MASVGRNFKVSWGGVTIAGCQSKSMTINRNAIDITNDDDAGVRALLAAPGQIDIDVSVDGVVKGTVLRSAALNPATPLTAVVLTFPSAPNITGTCFLSNYSESGSHNDAIKFSATLMFSGAVT